jgi:hypothetical protein
MADEKVVKKSIKISLERTRKILRTLNDPLYANTFAQKAEVTEGELGSLVMTLQNFADQHASSNGSSINARILEIFVSEKTENMLSFAEKSHPFINSKPTKCPGLLVFFNEKKQKFDCFSVKHMKQDSKHLQKPNYETAENFFEKSFEAAAYKPKSG